jgi:hypothetical protein
MSTTAADATPKRFDRNLREIFWPVDREFITRVARLCVLYEDLRIESQGAREMEAIPKVDGLSKAYRQFYFLRRSLVTLIEFHGALSQINTGAWENWIKNNANADLRRKWTEAVRFFNENREHWVLLRGNVGGHYPESAARYAIEGLHPDATGALEANISAETIGSFKLHFCTELVGVTLRTSMPNQNSTDDEFDQYQTKTFHSLSKGWEHAAFAVQVLLVEFLARRFIREPDEHSTPPQVAGSDGA